MRWYRKWLARAGLYFPEPGREEAFREFFVERHVNLMQAFLLGGAILSTASVFWHESIDPVGAPDTHWIKLAVFPLLLLPQALLLLPAMRRHAETLVILPPMTALLTQLLLVMPVLDGGMAYTAHPTMQTMLFFIAFMRARFLYVVSVSLFSAVAFVVAHRLAPENAARLLEINAHFVWATAGAVMWAAYWQDRLHRRQFDTLQALDAARVAAEQANQAKMRFLASASHDLRQPIHSLGLNVYALKNRVRYPEQKEVLAEIELAVGAMQTMFNSLLDLSRLASGLVKPDLASLSVSELLRELESMFGAAARDKGLELRLRACRGRVRSDPQLLRQILQNLVANAVRYSERGGVLVGCRRRGATLSIEVWDTGPGIAKEALDSIFVEFVRLGQQGREGDRGLGIGLAIVREACHVLGHALAARSRPGRGSCFAVRVPLTDEAPVAQPAVRAEADRVFGAFVVVIDDDREALDSMRRLLELWGCHSVLAGSGRQALEALGRHERIPDLIVCDYELAGGETADDAVRRIHGQVWPDIPVLVITATGLAADMAGRTHNGYRILRKPLAAEALRAAMHEALAPPPGS
ncbi:MAG: hybrid sensor histidine kinase/response regulator [Zoogloeaceae bacterium]|nr:hybrid sensor histidine kinase/response regulator [Zoogloeaceae bacterium]MCK6385721.1 hybrid sensor histidine kinase/response regulator [Rhodocyclaceae bacterium]